VYKCRPLNLVLEYYGVQCTYKCQPLNLAPEYYKVQCVYESIQFTPRLGLRRRRPGCKIIINRALQMPPESSPEPLDIKFCSLGMLGTPRRSWAAREKVRTE
jgi:hypothetical protein